MTEQERRQCVQAATGLTCSLQELARLFSATLGRVVTRDEALGVVQSVRHRVGKRGMNKRMKMWRSF